MRMASDLDIDTEVVGGEAGREHHGWSSHQAACASRIDGVQFHGSNASRCFAG